MSLWQDAAIRLARSKSMTKFAQSNPLMRGLASRFVGGADLSAALTKASALKTKGYATSLYYLGEYVNAAEVIEENIAQIVALIRQAAETDLDVLISVDPSQIGYALSDELGEKNALHIAQVFQEKAGNGRHLLMLDMEDFSYVQRTLALRSALARQGCPAAITIQAYLRRSEQDVRDLVQDGVTAVRLVKGAFAESRERAFSRKADVIQNYFRLATLLLSPEAKAKGVYPIFATHDEALIERVAAVAQENNRSADEYEIEMLYGVRTTLQERFVAKGRRVRLYLPFGTEWWPYSVRRVGERPANVRFVLRAIWKN
jgi:proline dehydrogenase